MKTCHNLFVGVVFFILCCTMFTACVNHISEEEGEIINNGDIPLKFVADIHEIMNTRVVNNSFGEKDEVGLFALAGTTTMQEERYADNLHFVRSSTGEFVSDESVYYPDDGVTLNLISYYPYQNSGVAMGESSMQVTVATTQDKLDDYSHSDFLVASKKEDMEKVFIRFYQGKQEIGGSGVGLSYAKMLVELHKGKIGAMNNEAGGATFFFDLPLGLESGEVICQPKPYINELITPDVDHEINAPVCQMQETVPIEVIH